MELFTEILTMIDFTYRGLLEDHLEYMKGLTPENSGLNNKQIDMLRSMTFENVPDHDDDHGVLIMRMDKAPVTFTVYDNKDVTEPGQIPEIAFQQLFRLIFVNGFLGTFQAAAQENLKIQQRQTREN